MKDLEDLKKVTIEELNAEIKIIHKKIKAIKAIKLVFDVIIIMITVLYIFKIDFSESLVFPAIFSVFLHTFLSYLNEKKNHLNYREFSFKYLNK